MSSPSPTTLATLTQIPDAGFLEVEARLDSRAESLVLYREGAQVRAWLNICRTPAAG